MPCLEFAQHLGYEFLSLYTSQMISKYDKNFMFTEHCQGFERW